MITLILPPDRWNDMRFPVGILSISSVLSRNGYENVVLDSKLLDGTDKNPDDLILENLRKTPSMIVGLSSYIHEQVYVAKIAKKIKELNKEIFVMVGGPQPTVAPEFYLKSGVDLVVRGEGEETIIPIIEEIKGSRDFEKINGVSFIRNGEVFSTPSAPMIKDLNILPLPAYDTSNIKHYARISSRVIRGVPLKTASIMTSRGCPFSCTYCMGKLITGKKVRFRSPELIYEEVKLLRDSFGFEAIYFLDDTLSVSKDYVKNICLIMKELGMLWGAQERVNTVSASNLRDMAKSGCVQLDFGIESGSNRVLNEIAKKNITVEQSLSSQRLVKSFGIRTFSNFMIGFPTETRKEMWDTFKLAKKIKSDEYIFAILMPIPGTPIWDMVNPDIPPDRMSEMNFFGGELVDLYNRSEVKNLERVRTKFTNSLYIRSRFRKLLFYPRFLFKLSKKNFSRLPNRIVIDLLYEINLAKGQMIYTLKNIKPLRKAVRSIKRNLYKRSY
ncbi:B12-binding domain-containing radical SAM protein [Candidatus Hakubella thermalkaliphila]|uniref:Uncharacterized protein n=1 Tax=Candidatus Hakubella thermalkaliphila TaxID=2754717 RepID=A0A6V8P804_9ACTN|nr:radical SAM protein [Candidatus Hakubella thermalkaliphila]GFP26896.1 hypothetical protein HKBW3S33_00310 [Candidatus Hakubella thermalkaliphila]